MGRVRVKFKIRLQIRVWLELVFALKFASTSAFYKSDICI